MYHPVINDSKITGISGTEAGIIGATYTTRMRYNS
jgi:hypothetical protein